MKNKNVSVVFHSFNGNVGEEVKFIDVGGAKFEADAEGKVKIGDDGKPIPFVEKKAEDIKIDPASSDLEALAKINPEVAKLLADKKKIETDLAAKSEADKQAEEKRLKETGEWQKLAEARQSELDKALEQIKQKDGMLGKYVESTEKILKDILATIPKDNLVLIPSDYSPRQKLEYITANAKLLGAKISNINGGEGVDKNEVQVNGTEEEQLVKEIDELIKKGDKKTKTELDILYEKSKKLTELRTKRIQDEKK